MYLKCILIVNILFILVDENTCITDLLSNNLTRIMETKFKIIVIIDYILYIRSNIGKDIL